MAAFAIYTYKFRDVDNIGIYAAEEKNNAPLLTLKEKQDFVQQIFRDDLAKARPFECRLWKERKNKTTNKKERIFIGYKSQVVWENNGIIVLQIANNKPSTRHENFKKIRTTDEPWCYVIIDNRYEREFVAIEKNSAFRSPDVVAMILEHSLRDRLVPRHVTIEITSQYSPEDFWAVVDKHKDRGIREVSFCFAAPNNPWASQLLNHQNDAARQMKARPTTTFTAPDDDPLVLDRDNEELQTYAKVCATTGEDIVVLVKGTKQKIHVKKIKDKYVFRVMNDSAYAHLSTSAVELFDSNYTDMATFLNSINPLQ